MKKIECIIMDWAGTAVDYGCFAPVAAFIESFNVIGTPVTAAETRAHMGLTLEEVNALPAAELTIRKQDVRRRMLAAGAHYVIDSVEELPAVIDDINNFKIPRI